jgi:hypothetical protein
MKILLGNCNTNVGKKDICKSTIGSEHLHEPSNDNVVRVANFSTSKNVIVKSLLLPHIAKFINSLGLLLMERHHQTDHILIGYTCLMSKYSGG